MLGAPRASTARRAAVAPLSRWLPASVAAWIAASVAASTLGACGAPKRAPGPLRPDDGDTGASVIDTSVDPRFDTAQDTAINCSADAAGVCACKELGQKPTSLYLVLDRSGSMSYIVPPGSESAWKVVSAALLDVGKGVLRKLGGRIAVGAARFPGDTGSKPDECAPGSEVLDFRVGSTATYDLLAKILNGEVPLGGTPTAATLRALSAQIKKLPPPVYVLLATDGGPNCGSTGCGIDRCIPNIERMSYSGGVCDTVTNCCAPPDFSPKNCLDTPATKAAVEDLVSAGVKVLVLGIPNDKIDLYSSELDALATAGGMPREGAAQKYYAAKDVAGLQEALSAIAAKVVDSCVVNLEGPVSDPGITNVLLDGDLVPQDPVDGWSWVDDTHAAVRLNGKSCDRVKAGVANLKVAVGCKTLTK